MKNIKIDKDFRGSNREEMKNSYKNCSWSSLHCKTKLTFNCLCVNMNRCFKLVGLWGLYKNDIRNCRCFVHVLRGLKIITGTNIKVLRFPLNYNHFNFFKSLHGLAIVVCIGYLKSRFITTTLIYLFLVTKFPHTIRDRTLFYNCLWN